MTVKALEGRLETPAAPLPDPAGRKGEQDSYGFAPNAVPPGTMVKSELFYPNPDNDPNSSALFNVFVGSDGFTGDVYLLKRAPSSSEVMAGWHFRAIRHGEDIKYTLSPGEAVCDTVQEPENGVGYMLALWSDTPDQAVDFRMSL